MASLIIISINYKQIFFQILYVKNKDIKCFTILLSSTFLFWIQNKRATEIKSTITLLVGYRWSLVGKLWGLLYQRYYYHWLRSHFLTHYSSEKDLLSTLFNIHSTRVCLISVLVLVWYAYFGQKYLGYSLHF